MQFKSPKNQLLSHIRRPWEPNLHVPLNLWNALALYHSGGHTMGAFEKAVPEEANKGPSLSETSHVIQKEPNTIFTSVDPLLRGHRRPFPGSFKEQSSEIPVFCPYKCYNLKRLLEKGLFSINTCWERIKRFGLGLKRETSYNNIAHPLYTTRFSIFNHVSWPVPKLY